MSAAGEESVPAAGAAAAVAADGVAELDAAADAATWARIAAAPSSNAALDSATALWVERQQSV